MDIIKKTSTTNTTFSPGRKIKYIVEHYTAGVTSRQGSARNTASWFAQARAKASADFIVDDVETVQFNPDPANRYCWSVGGGSYHNKGGRLYGIVKSANSISIEICSTNKTGKVTNTNDSNWYFTDAVVDRAAELTKYLMQKYGIDADHVIRHYDVNGKPCPGIIGWNAETGDESKWRAFQSRISYGAASTVDTGSILLKKGSRGDSVKTMQQMLINAGYDLGPCGADGIFGSDTEKALKMFQSNHNLDVDAIFGSLTKSALEGAQNVSDTSGDSTILRKGEKGEAVKQMQTMLIATGYSCGKTGADADFGKNTLAALKAFQKDHDLDVDGLYGPLSRAALTAVYQAVH